MEAFKIFDKFGQGKIDAEGLKDVMMNYGEKLTEEEWKEHPLFDLDDIDNDGNINILEFVKRKMD